MLYFEDVMVVIFLTVVGILSFIGWRYARKHPETAMKIICMAALVAMALTAFAFAGAEPAEVEYYSVDKIVATEVIFDNFWPTTRIDFIYHENILSWYENGFVLPWNHYVIKVWREREVVNSALL